MNLKRFFSIAWERHRIFVLKEYGISKPWTNDEIFLNWYFCNVFRRLDKTSRWIEKNIIEATTNITDSWKWIMLARYISRIDTLEKLYLDIGRDLLAAYRILRSMQTNGEKIFTNAFIVNSKIPGGWTDKVTYIYILLKEVEKKANENGYPLFDFFLRNIKTMEESYNFLYGLPGVGAFMAYQYTVDFTYSTRYLANAHDTHTWTILGLGAVRGMNRLLGNMANRNKIDHPIERSRDILQQWEDHITEFIEEEIDTTHEIISNRWTHPDPPPDWHAISFWYNPFLSLSLMDVEHWLCEYDKYMRGGSKKRRYYGRDV